jgi:hypothetical protein
MCKSSSITIISIRTRPGVTSLKKTCKNWLTFLLLITPCNILSYTSTCQYDICLQAYQNGGIIEATFEGESCDVQVVSSLLSDSMTIGFVVLIAVYLVLFFYFLLQQSREARGCLHSETARQVFVWIDILATIALIGTFVAAKVLDIILIRLGGAHGMKEALSFETGLIAY